MSWKESARAGLRLLRRQWGWAVVAVLSSGILLAIGRAFWTMQLPAHRLTTSWDQIAIPTPPPLFPATFFQEVRALGGFPDALDLREPNLPDRLRKALARHPWIADVQEVRIVPGKGVSVDLTYRVPVAKVEGPFHQANDPAYLVDADGRWMTTSAEDGPRLPRILGVSQPPTGEAGQPWGLPAVEVAVRLLVRLGADVERWGIVAVRLDADPLLPDVRLVTSGGSQVIWTSQDVDKARDEPDETRKRAWVSEYLADAGSLDKPAGPYVLDVTRPTGMTRQPLRP